MTVRAVVASAALLALSGAARAAGPGMVQIEATCAWSQSAAKFKKAVLAAGGTLEPLHFHEGLAVLAAGKTARQARAIQASARALAGEVGAFQPGSERDGAACKAILGAAAQGRLTVQVESSSKGAVVAFFSPDAEVVHALQQGGCCSFCVCPAGSVTNCARCC